MSLFSKIRHFTTKLIMNWLNPEPEQQQTGTQITKPSSDDHIKVVYGERKIAGTIVFYNTTNPDDGDDVKNDLLHIIVVWCEGGIESIDDILLNDISITDSKFSAKKGGRWAYATHFTNGMGGYSDPHLKASGWDAATKDHRLDGLACSYIRLEWSLGDDTPFTGLPDLNAVIRGRKVKNLETGVTEYSENPAYCTLDYLTHPIFGKNLSASEYDLDSFKTAGLVAKTQVPEYQGASTTKPLFTCNLAIDTSASLLDNVELLGKSMRALMPIINGRLTLIIEQDEEPTEYGLSERDFKGSLKYDDGGKDKRYNRVIVEYIDKELSYSDQDAIYPEPDSELADQWLAEDNGVLLEYRFKVSSCNNYYEARQMARIIAMISRESLNFNVLCAPIAMRYTVGDVVPISHNKLGWDKKPFRLIKSVQQSTGQFLLTFREHQPYIYNWLSGVVRPPIPDTSLPDPRNVAEPVNFTSTLLNDGNVKINWESVYNHFDIQIYKNGTLLSTTTSVTPSFIISALDAGNYEMDVRAASKIGFRSQWVSFGFSVALPAEPSVDIDAVTYNTITLSASVTGASLGTTFEWQFLGQTAEPNANPNTASGYNYIYTGLVPDTEYSFKVRTKNLSGVSPWVDVAVKTSLSDLLDYIDDIPLQKLSDDAQTLIEDINTQVDRLRPETQNNLPDLIASNIGAIDLQRIEQEDMALAVLDAAASYTNWRTEYERRTFTGEMLIDAAAFVDPGTGKIINRAFAYTDKSFNSASLLIDGVKSTITLNAQELTRTQKRVTNAEAELIVQAGKISQRATFSEVESQIAGALEALQPAYSWQFNSGSEGFNPDSHNAKGYIVATNAITSGALSYNATENPIFRLRVRKHATAPWKGAIKFNSSATVINLPEPSGAGWEVVSVDATAASGYSGTITSLKFDLGPCDIDFIEVGKRGANDLALKDITARTSVLESELNAVTGTIGQYAKTAWVNDQGYQTQSNVNQTLDSFNSTYKVSATLQEFSVNGTLEKANNAQTFINGADAYIENRITTYIGDGPGGIGAKLSDASQRLDAAEGVARTSISQITGIELDLKDKTFDDIVSEYSKFATTTDLTKVGVKASLADEKLKAQTTELESIAEQSVNLAALFNKNAALINNVTRALANDEKASVIRDERYKAKFEENTARFSDVTTAIAKIDEANVIRDQEMESFVFETVSSFDEVAQTFASQEQAYTTLGKTLTAKIGNDTLEAKNTAIATAQQYTRTAVGYCVNAQGQISSESDAVACVAAGGSWVAGPLAEFIENLQISEGGKTASIKQIRQVFKTVGGELVARGGWQLDNNGRAVGVVGYNDGQIGNLDLVGDVIRQGAMVGNTFVPTSYVDNTDPAKPLHVIRGRLELGDGHVVTSLDDIKAQDGKRGAERETVATATGIWYDSVANAAMPDGAAVLNDIVTIYKSGDPSVETTKRFNGSTWQSYTLRMHGSALIEDTLDAKVIRAGSEMTSPRLTTPAINYNPTTGARTGNFSTDPNGNMFAKGATLESVTIKDNHGNIVMSSTGAIPSSKVTGLGDLATKNGVSYNELSGRPNFGAFAFLSSLGYSDLSGKPTLGSLAAKNSLSYNEVTGRPTLGSLAYLNSLAYDKVTGKPTLGPFAGLSKILSSNVTTYIANGAIGSAQIDTAYINSLFGQNASFYGTVYAQNLEGDVYDVKFKDTTAVRPTSSNKTLVSFTVSAQPFARNVVISEVEAYGQGYSSQDSFSINASMYGSHTASALDNKSWLGRGDTFQTFLLPSFVTTIPANTTRTFSIKLETTGSSGTSLGIRGTVKCEVFKDGSTIS
ncbi:hypothetical protein PH505_bb00640 [Pseudoalteromonas distincta]|uniref:fibronectin type III domain-containing protein n=1 Tax=Pseudoalteromonas distincta TaxID=77608 RepID=UPI00020A0FE7|nr:fibronectin type III domain-containing protein [Pseudoalteromonas distincta]EGI72916.1 hypothetical protein PH505_bb00640 [Pseudoalteromonas distincta]